MVTDVEIDHEQHTMGGRGTAAAVRRALWLALGGSIVFWIGLPFPVVTDFFESEDAAERIEVVTSARTQFGIAFALLGLGAAIAGVGLWLLGRAVAPIEAVRSRRREIAATTASWLGLTGLFSGVSRALHAAIASPEFMEDGDNVIDPVLGGIAWPATSVCLVILGVLAWSGPPPRWTAVVLVLGGVAGMVTFLPLFWFAALIVFAIANLIVMRRNAGASGAGLATSQA